MAIVGDLLQALLGLGMICAGVWLLMRLYVHREDDGAEVQEVAAVQDDVREDGGEDGGEDDQEDDQEDDGEIVRVYAYEEVGD